MFETGKHYTIKMWEDGEDGGVGFAKKKICSREPQPARQGVAPISTDSRAISGPRAPDSLTAPSATSCN